MYSLKKPGFSILFCAPAYIEAYKMDQMISLMRRGYDVSALLMKKPKKVLEKNTIEYDFKKNITYINVNGSKVLKIFLFAWWFIRALIINPLKTFLAIYRLRLRDNFLSYSTIAFFIIAGKYGLIHVHNGHAGVFISKMIDAIKLPVVVSFYGWDFSQDLPLRPGEYNKMFATVDKITAMSEFMKKRLVKYECPEEKIEIVRIWAKDIFLNFSEMKKPISKNKVQILSVGRLSTKKGYDVCLKVMKLLKKSNEQFHYTIIGDGPLNNELQNLCLELDLKDEVTFKGAISRDDVKPYMEQCDIFLIHSVTGPDGDMEGTPTVILEAGLLRKPVVSTYHSGIPEIVDNSMSGYLTEEKDVGKTKDYLSDLIHDQEKRNSFGEALRNKILAEYSEEVNCPKFIKIYNDISYSI